MPQVSQSCQTEVICVARASPVTISANCRGDDLSYSVAEHDGGGERTHHPVQKDAQARALRRSLRGPQPEFGLQRKHQDADHSHGGGRRQHSQEYDGDDGPSVMDAHPLKCPRQKS